MKTQTVSYQKMLVEYMQAKQKEINKHNKLYRYFTNKDKIAILNFKDKISKKIWEFIHNYISDDGRLSGNDRVIGLCADMCPFCIKLDLYSNDDDECKKCEYNKNRGKSCLECDSDWNKYARGKLEDIFSENWYKNTFRKISKKHGVSYE